MFGGAKGQRQHSGDCRQPASKALLQRIQVPAAGCVHCCRPGGLVRQLSAAGQTSPVIHTSQSNLSTCQRWIPSEGLNRGMMPKIMMAPCTAEGAQSACCVQGVQTTLRQRWRGLPASAHLHVGRHVLEDGREHQQHQHDGEAGDHAGQRRLGAAWQGREGGQACSGGAPGRGWRETEPDRLRGRAGAGLAAVEPGGVSKGRQQHVHACAAEECRLTPQSRSLPTGRRSRWWCSCRVAGRGGRRQEVGQGGGQAQGGWAAGQPAVLRRQRSARRHIPLLRSHAALPCCAGHARLAAKQRGRPLTR